MTDEFPSASSVSVSQRSDTDGSNLEMAYDSVANRSNEPLANRLRLVLWIQHQPYIAWLLLTCLLAMAAFFLVKAKSGDGLADIDDATALTAEFNVDINSAGLGEIIVLPGIGEKLAQAIIDHRESNGRFQGLEELREVPGIGEKKLETLIPFLLPIKHAK